MHPQFKDVVTRYSPDITFSDGEWDLTSAEWKSPELLAWLFKESPCKDTVVVDDRWGKYCRHHHGTYYTTEYGAGYEGRLPSMGGKPRHGLFLLVQPRGTHRRLQDGPGIRPHAGGPGQPRRQFPARYRPVRRWHHSACHGRTPAANGRLAKRQRRGNLPHAPRRTRLPVDRRQASGAGLRRVP